MISDLRKEEFESRLQELTAIGEPLIMGSPFAIFTIFENSDKPFLGEFDKNEFRLTRNSILPFSNAGYIIKGRYFNDEANKLRVDYEIKPILFSYVGARLLPILLIISINIGFFLSEKTTIKACVFANTVLFGILFLVIQLDLWSKRKLERKFLLNFRIRERN